VKSSTPIPVISRCCGCQPPRRYTVIRWFKHKQKKFCAQCDPFTAHIRFIRQKRRSTRARDRRNQQILEDMRKTYV
jgi:hypothetical protein